MAFRAGGLLADAELGADVSALCPDYRALLVLAEGLTPGPSDDTSEAMLRQAERRAVAALGDNPPEAHPHVAAWREAFRAFGAKPQRTRPSVEALLRRCRDGLPRVDRLTDAYNAVSVTHILPVGGEDADRYQGPPRLTRASGDEVFETTSNAEDVVEHPVPGEVVWRDDAGVTCRRWNWRQCTRTRLTTSTTRAIFVLDALAPLSDAALRAARDDLCAALDALGPGVRTETRLLR